MRPAVADRDPVLALRNVSKRYPGVMALRDVSLELRAGQVVGLLGENGAGNSTLVKILSGATAPTAGEMVIGGRSISFSSPTEALRAGIATVFQEGSLVPNLTVRPTFCSVASRSQVAGSDQSAAGGCASSPRPRSSSQASS